MKRKAFFSAVVGFACAMAVMPGATFAADLKEGDTAPDFELTGSDGKSYKLADLKGKAVVVAWFPKAFTGGCTKECISMSESSEKIQAFDVAYFTASCDTVEKNTAFAESLKLNYPILSDPGKKVAEAYGVVHEGRAVPERWTFYIDAEGKIAHVDKKINTSNAGGDIAAKLEELKVAKK